MPYEIGFEIHIPQSFDLAVERVIAALKAEGFGVLTRIDVRATMKEKLDADFRPYVILGACNPPLAHRALSADGQMGLLLPCNVTVEELPDQTSLVRIADPEAMLQASTLANNPELQAVAETAREKLEKVGKSLV